MLINIDKILVDRDRRQRRELPNIESLADSLRRTGLINPIVVKPLADERYHLVAGERRLAAAKSLSWTQIEARVFSALSQTEQQIVELEENIAREDLVWQDLVASYIEIYNLYKQLDPTLINETIAEKLGITKTYLSTLLTLYDEMHSGSSKAETLRAMSSVGAALNAMKRFRDREAAQEDEQLLTSFKITTAPSADEDFPALRIAVTDIPKKEQQRPLEIITGDFREWAPRYQGERFNLIHCDFPYGVKHHRSEMGNTKSWGGYQDTDETYWNLCASLAANSDRLLAASAHIIFWLSMNKWIETRAFFEEHIPQIKWDPFPLIWFKSDNVGILPDASRGTRRVYEAALFGTVGDRKVVRAVANCVAAPTQKNLAKHQSEKPFGVCGHFFNMLIDDTTRMLDPTCGGGAALLAAADRNPAFVLGVEINPEFADAARSRFM